MPRFCCRAARGAPRCACAPRAARETRQRGHAAVGEPRTAGEIEGGEAVGDGREEVERARLKEQQAAAMEAAEKDAMDKYRKLARSYATWQQLHYKYGTE